ncbi:LamG-like jellyroll fold domain-containing protein [Micromonospora sp. NBC_01796]|uniref:LamG-like jellyroll fold domain-containing protein n=1 Tax=Micromonospora sp. NBC_01796 TaxID=2975987 RepID=UPI002DD8A6C9|nr:LamG-like jellyroll fold domain-containing protein [Micromonospora sp. NBC_01796]WSA86205.1 metallophosphoesterase [Micromonospora sp. NBC_01796]
MQEPIDNSLSPVPGAASRRTFLRGAGLVGAGAAAAGVLGVAAQPALAADQAAGTTATGNGKVDPENPRFTIAVIPDTQYLFDGDRGDPAPLTASLRYILDQREEHNIVFAAHLGDVVENAAASELTAAGKVFEIFDKRKMPYSVLAGNHDIDSRTDDQRGPSAYLDVFPPSRFAPLSTFGGSTPDGYNTYHLVRAAGREWLVFALDWRASAGTIAWAKQVLAAHPRTPAILTTHEVASADAAGKATLSAYGQSLWDNLVKDSDQIFLTLNGHYWPSGRTVLTNAAGHDVHVHVTDYQDRYYGGSAMIRLYHFDLARNTIDVETLSPWILGKPAERRNPLEQGEIELTGLADRFSLAIDFPARFAGFAPVPVPPVRPVKEMLVKGTVGYWRFDQSATDGATVPDGYRVNDLSGNGNDLTRVTLAGSDATALRWSTEHHPAQPTRSSLRFAGGKKPARGAYLRTADAAPMNTMTFTGGYTIEAFVKLPADAKSTNHAWMSVVSRFGAGADAGKTGGDPAEPLATLSLSDGMALQWAFFPTNQNDISTNWGHEMRTGEWFHVAVVNDGQHTVLYVDGAPLLRNPSTPAIGLATSGEPWFFGAYHYDRLIEQGFYGWLGDVRIVDHALPVARFMNATA